jgi:hypothetical protein
MDQLFFFLACNNDGNLVVYNQNWAGTHRLSDTAVWSSHTYNEGAPVLCLQSDGNLVIYNGDTPLWASHTNYY